MPSPSYRTVLADDNATTRRFMKALVEKAQCGTGFIGRIAIHELFILTDPVRSLIVRNASILDIQQLAKDHGFRSMLHDGLKKVLRGLTTLEELERAIAATS